VTNTHPPRVDEATGLRWLVSAVFDLPYATQACQCALAGLKPWEWQYLRILAERKRLIEACRIAQAPGRPGLMRLGPTSAAGQLLATRGMWSLSQLADAFTSFERLDSARSLIPPWLAEEEADPARDQKQRNPKQRKVFQVPWALSPFWVSAKYLHGLTPPSAEGTTQFDPLRPLRLDLLASLALKEQTQGEQLLLKYHALAVVVDPGGAKMDWFYQTLRSFLAWTRRPEFSRSGCYRPMLVVIAANELREGQMEELWASMVPDSRKTELSARLITRADLAQPLKDQKWRAGDGLPVRPMWGGTTTPSLMPFVTPRPESNAPWWGQTHAGGETVVPGPALPLSANTGMLRAAVHLPGWRWQAVRDAQLVSARGRQMLEQIGRYPLIEPAALYSTLRQRPRGHQAGTQLQSLLSLKLVERRPRPTGLGQPPRPDGLRLTERGLGLLAAMAGIAPATYLHLRRWPGGWDEHHQFEYSTEGLEAIADHYQVTLDFMQGLLHTQHGERFQLLEWDHSQCIYNFFNPRWLEKMQEEGEAALQALVVPDATGRVARWAVHGSDFKETTFWVEVDRIGHTGARLEAKLQKYLGALDAQVRRNHRTCLLFVIDGRGEPGDHLSQPDEAPVEVHLRAEMRLQELRRVWAKLEQLEFMRQNPTPYGQPATAFKPWLDVLLVGLDRLAVPGGAYDPSLPVWRTPYDSTFREAFNAPAEDPSALDTLHLPDLEQRGDRGQLRRSKSDKGTQVESGLPREKVAVIRARHPLEATLARFGVELHRQRPEDNFAQAVCPFHAADGRDGREPTPTLVVNHARQTWRCLGGCELSGDVIDFVGRRRYGAAWNRRRDAQFRTAVAILDGQVELEPARRRRRKERQTASPASR